MVACGQSFDGGPWTSLGMVAHGQALDGGLWTGLGWYPVNKPWMVACEQALDGSTGSKYKIIYHFHQF